MRCTCVTRVTNTQSELHRDDDQHLSVHPLERLFAGEQPRSALVRGARVRRFVRLHEYLLVRRHVDRP